MLTTKFFITTDGRSMLRLRIINNRKKTELTMGFEITPEELELALNGQSKDIRLVKTLAVWNAIIRELKVELAESHKTDMDVKEVRKILKYRLLGIEVNEKASQGDFTREFQSFIDGKEKPGTKGVYKHTLDKIRAFDSDIDRKQFEDIDLKWLTAFEAYCAKTATKNARNIHLRNIRAVFNHAIDYEITTAYPFRRFKIRPEPTRKRALSVEELRKLFDYPCEPYAEIYRDMFKLIFMLIGINSVDLHGLKRISKEGYIEYKRAKTGRLYSIKVEPEAMAIIEKYRGEKGLLCIADRWSDSRNFSHQCNKALKLIGAKKNKGGRNKGGTPKKADKENAPKGIWPELTTYWARHSWATIARSLRVSKDDIALALGHGAKTVTDIYIDDDMTFIDEANRKVLDWVLYGKR